MKRRGFTITELLVVVVVIAVLVGLLFPVISGVRRAARGSACLANLSQLAKVIGMYSETYKRFPRTEEVADEAFENLTLPRLTQDDPSLTALPRNWKCPLDMEWPAGRASYSFLPARFMRPASDNADYRPTTDEEGLETPQAILRMFEQSAAIPILEDALRFHISKERREQANSSGGLEGLQAAYLDGSARPRK